MPALTLARLSAATFAGAFLAIALVVALQGRGRSLLVGPKRAVAWLTRPAPAAPAPARRAAAKPRARCPHHRRRAAAAQPAAAPAVGIGAAGMSF